MPLCPSGLTTVPSPCNRVCVRGWWKSLQGGGRGRALLCGCFPPALQGLSNLGAAGSGPVWACPKCSATNPCTCSECGCCGGTMPAVAAPSASPSVSGLATAPAGGHAGGHPRDPALLWPTASSATSTAPLPAPLPGQIPTPAPILVPGLAPRAGSAPGGWWACHGCGSLCPPGAPACPNCRHGAPLVAAPAAATVTVASGLVPSTAQWACVGCMAPNNPSQNFCGACGAPKPVAQAPWPCSCTSLNPASTAFCGACGAPGPWVCACSSPNPGPSLFCGRCGTRRPSPGPGPSAPSPWACSCGAANAPTAQFCGGCGTRRGSGPAPPTSSAPSVGLMPAVPPVAPATAWPVAGPGAGVAPGTAGLGLEPWSATGPRARHISDLFVFHDGENAYVPPTVRDGSLLYSLALEETVQAAGVPLDSLDLRRVVVDWKLYLPSPSPANARFMPSESVLSALRVCGGGGQEW
jgi:hypothetical protein